MHYVSSVLTVVNEAHVYIENNGINSYSPSLSVTDNEGERSRGEYFPVYDSYSDNCIKS